MNVAIDLGNSFAKVGEFKDTKLIKHHESLTDEKLFELLDNILYTVENIIISSVRSNYSFLTDFLKERNKNFLVLSSNTPVPLKVEYKSQSTLGMDRLAAAIGGEAYFPGQNCLIIDAGTCITYEFVDKNGVYKGGAISPGINLKLKALNTFTQKLPLIEFKKEFNLIGQTTEESILSGVLFGTVAEVEGFIKYYQQQFKDLRIIICGGNANFFESRIKAPIFVVPELVLLGLFRILQYNVSKNK